MVAPIGSNPSALTSQRGLNDTRETQNRLLGQIASGKRINQAADDAAGSAIVERFAAQIAGADRAARNLSDGISLAQTAEGAVSTVQDNTSRIRELTVQAGNGTLNAGDRQAIQQEIDALSQSNDDTLRNANFNGQPLFQGGNLSFQAGANAGDQVSVSLGNLASGGIGRVDVSSAASATAALDQLDDQLGTLSDTRATLGAVNSRFESAIGQLQSRSENLSAARSRINDTDYAAASTDLAAQNIRAQADVAVQAQANASSRQVLSLLRA